MRPHMSFFVNHVKVFDLAHPTSDSDEVMLLHTLSGG